MGKRDLMLPREKKKPWSYPFRPRYAGDRVVVRGQVAEPGDLRGAGRPQVHAGAQAHAQHVLGGPVHQVKVEVVLQLGGVQHLEFSVMLWH